MKSFVTFLILLTNTLLMGQQGTITAGGDQKSADGEINFSIGQVMNSSTSTPTGSACEGLQQPFEIIWTSLSSWGKELGIKVLAFPNPTADQLNLVFDASPPPGSLAICTDAAGRTVLHQQIDQLETRLDMYALPSGTYFLNILTNQSHLSSLTIFKQ